jgi:hypothetical protein
MKTHRKFSLFILGVLVCGCPKQAQHVDPAPERIEADEIDPQAELEAACYEGDPAACDQLGH